MPISVLPSTMNTQKATFNTIHSVIFCANISNMVYVFWGFLGGSAAAAKSLQSCLTLCNPIDSNPPGSSVPGILQARILEWVAISFSGAWKWKVKVKSLSHVRLLATPWTAAHQAPPSMGFSRQEYWSGLPLPSPLGGSDDRDSACNAGDPGSIPGWGRSLEERNGYPFRYSCWKNPMNKGAWWATVHGVVKSWTWLSNQQFHFYVL